MQTAQQSTASLQRPPSTGVSSHSGLPHRRQWHSDQDGPLRQRMRESIFQLFKKRKAGSAGPAWEQKIPDFANRMEDALYKSAATQEEYLDKTSLERRLQAVAQMVHSNQSAAQRRKTVPNNMQVSQPGMPMSMPNVGTGNVSGMMVSRPMVGNMIPTPGMMPTPGMQPMLGMRQHGGYTNGQTAIGSNAPLGSGMMIPTPGLPLPQPQSSRGSEEQAMGVSGPNMNTSGGITAPTQSQQQYIPGTYPYQTVNGQPPVHGTGSTVNGMGTMTTLSTGHFMSPGQRPSEGAIVDNAVANGNPYMNGSSNMQTGQTGYGSSSQQQQQRQRQLMQQPKPAQKPQPQQSNLPGPGAGLNACQRRPSPPVSKMIPVPGQPMGQQSNQIGGQQHSQQQTENYEQRSQQSQQTGFQRQTGRQLQGQLIGSNGLTTSARPLTGQEGLSGNLVSSQQHKQMSQSQISQSQMSQPQSKSGMQASNPSETLSERVSQHTPNGNLQNRTRMASNWQNRSSDMGPVGSPPSALSNVGSAVAVISPLRGLQYLKQRRFLVMLRHGQKCEVPQCTVPNCLYFRELFQHVSRCRDPDCKLQRCHESGVLLEHYRGCQNAFCPVCIPIRHGQCRDTSCPVCIPVKRAYEAGMRMIRQGGGNSNNNNVNNNISAPQADTGPAGSGLTDARESGNTYGQVSPAKRLKLDVESSLQSDGTGKKVANSQSQSQTQTQSQGQSQSQGSSAGLKVAQDEKLEGKQSDLKPPANAVKVESSTDAAYPGVSSSGAMKSEVSVAKQEPVEVERARTPPLVALVKSEVGGTIAPPNSQQAETATKYRGVGTSLTELFTPEMIWQHVRSLRQSVMQVVKGKTDKNQSGGAPSGDECKLCAVEKLFFDPPPIYCTVCGKRIQRQKNYYTTGNGEQKQFFCVKCFGDFRSETIAIDGYPTCQKSKLAKKVNNEESEEGWVECGTCKSWVHQVCALFNLRRNEGNPDFTCPECCARQMEKGDRRPLEPTAVLGAKDLPRTGLSDELEHRLARRLTQERAERARAQGKNPDQVTAAEELVIRVVSSVDKRLETKPRFLSIFPEGEYPAGFPYKSKEFGSDCEQPNNRRIYLSYLDSVKYFRPEVRTVTGEALRTYVYHEILIGYLDYCKKRGFTSCYIWACPPLKGEDYILYCHPEIQKTPQPAKLREWYLSMLKKAQQEKIVVEVCNLYETFFVTCGESKAPVRASRLPYFDGDYWPGAIEDVLQQLQEEEKDDSKKKGTKKGKKPKGLSKRGNMRGEDDVGGTTAMEDQLMNKLGESILSMKDDFIMVHLQYCCTHCRNFILGDRRWVCRFCSSFNLCQNMISLFPEAPTQTLFTFSPFSKEGSKAETLDDSAVLLTPPKLGYWASMAGGFRCYEAERLREPRDRHPRLSKDAHDLVMEELQPAPKDILDPDELMESEFFDTRQAFLSLCQGNHYQYDTLRRAKHSSMMVLYHLHNPTAPAFVSTCNVCHKDIDNGQGWRCEQCDYDICSSCQDSGNDHPHPLQPHISNADTSAQSKEGRKKRITQMRKMLYLLQHASRCKLGGTGGCNFPKCPSLHRLFRHGTSCKIRLNGGCELCKQMWRLLRFHARSCKENHCMVPRCKDLKEHMRRATQQMESRRRAAVQEMMRQRAAEARKQ